MISDVPYRFAIRPLPEEEGGGYLIEFPDLPGCMSDGETIEQAIANGIDAPGKSARWRIPGKVNALKKRDLLGSFCIFTLARSGGSAVGFVWQIECSGRAFEPLRMILVD